MPVSQAGDHLGADRAGSRRRLQHSKEHTVTYQLTNLTVVTGASSGIGAEIARPVSYTHLTLPTILLV